MYRVVIYNGNEETIIHSPTENPEAPHLYSCKLVQGSSGEIDSLTFCILPNNPGYEKLYSYTTMIAVIDTNATPEKAEFSGRVLSIGPQMEDSGLVYKQVVCEDRLGFLCDSIQPYKEKDTYTVREFFQLLLDNHNAQVDDYKKMYLGEVTFDTSSGNVTKGLNYQTTWEAITDKLLSLGGEIQLYSLNGLLYIDYVNELGTMGEQTIEIAKNMRSFEQDESPTEIITRLIPLGDYKEEQPEDAEDYERINIEPVNGGKNYLDDEDAQERYGILCGTVIWDDVTDPENLMEKGKQWLEDQGIEETITLSAYDLSIIGIEPDALERYNYYETINPLLGIDKYYRVAKRTVDVCNPTDITFTMGSQSKSISSTLTGASGQAKDAADASAALNANLTKTVATLIAGNAIILQLEATVAYIEDAFIDRATIDELLAAYATIEYLEAEYATILDLEAAFADVELLNADVANILNLLAGNVGTGDLQTIVLTADNAIIDDAIILNALMGTVLADLIQSNIIYTDQITIMSEDGGISIVGNQMQIVEGQLVFYNSDGNVRMQVGQDASGNFSFVLYDETGEGIMIDSEGVHASAIPDGLIVDQMVAEDANISASKLNIEELTDTLNANGQLVLSAEQITIGGGTLDYALTEIIEQIENLEAMEGIESVENYYILGGPDAPPWEPGEDGAAAILGEMILGEAILGTTHWTTEQPKASEGEYVWFSQKITYVNGDIVWTTPTLLTDDYVRNAITVHQTELEVIQGQIQAKIWLSDIETTADELTTIINDQYGILTVLIDAIDLRVGTLTTTVDYYYTELSSQVAAISLDLSSITAEVRGVDEKYSNALVEGTPYYAVSTDPNWYPPYDVEGRTSVLGKMILGEAILGLSDITWTTEQPEWKEGQYVWMTSLRERADGTTYWTEPTLLTDEWMRENATQMSEQYSQIVMQVDSISEAVVNVQSELALNYSTTTEITAIINAAVTDSASTILQEVEYNYVTQGFLSETLGNYYESNVVDALIELSASETSGLIMQQVSYSYATINYVDDALSNLDIDSVVGIETYYCVSDYQPNLPNEPYVFYEEDFTSGSNPGWTRWNTSGDNSIAWEDDVMGNCLSLTRGEGAYYEPGVMHDLQGMDGNYNVSCKAATKSGQEQQTVLRLQWPGDHADSEIGQLKADEWTTFSYDFSSSTSGSNSFYIYNYSDNSSSTTLLVKDFVISTEGKTWTTEQPDVGEYEKLWVCFLVTYTDGQTEWIGPICTAAGIDMQEFTSTIIQYVDDSMAALNLTVSGGLGNTASITLSTNGREIMETLDLTNVRQAFANDQSSITVSAGVITFVSGTFQVDADNLQITTDGRVITNRGNYETVMDGGYLEFYYSGSRSSYIFSDGSDSLRIQDVRELTVGSSEESGYRYIRLLNGKTSMDMRISSDKQGTVGLMDLDNGDWIIAKETENNRTYVGMSGVDTLIRGNNIEITNDTIVDGTVECDGLMSNNTINYRYWASSYSYLPLRITGNSDGDMGLQGSSSYIWMFAWNASSSSVYVGPPSSRGYSVFLRGDVYVHTTEAVTSDRQLKDNIEPFEPTKTDELSSSLIPRIYTLQDDPETKHIGFIVDEVEDAMREAGYDPDEYGLTSSYIDEDGNTVGAIRYDEFIPILLYEIQELRDRVETLESSDGSGLIDPGVQLN